MEGGGDTQQVTGGDLLTLPAGYEDFSGRHDRTLDDKGRVVLPTAGGWREHFGAGAKLTPSGDRLALWTQRSFREAVEAIRLQVRLGVVAATTLQDFREDAVDVKPDVQGRLQLPEALRHRFGIGDHGASVVLTGQGGRVEVWSPDHKAAQRAGRPQESYVDLLPSENF